MSNRGTWPRQRVGCFSPFGKLEDPEPTLWGVGRFWLNAPVYGWAGQPEGLEVGGRKESQASFVCSHQAGGEASRWFPQRHVRTSQGSR